MKPVCRVRKATVAVVPEPGPPLVMTWMWSYALKALISRTTVLMVSAGASSGQVT